MKLININRCRRPRAAGKALLALACLVVLMLPLTGGGAACAGYQPDLLVRLASQGDVDYLGGGVFETTAALQSKSQAAFPGFPASYRVQLRNAGDQADRFLIRGTGSGSGFAVSYGDGVSAAAPEGFTTGELKPGESLSFSVLVTPAALPLGVSYRVTIDASSLGASGNGFAMLDEVKTETVSCSSSAAVTLSVPQDSVGAPGSVVSYPYTLTNVGNAVNSFSLAVASAAGWPAAIYADDGAGGGVAGDGVRQPGETVPSASSGALAPGASYRFFVAVSVPAGSADGTHADVRLTATGAGAAAADLVTTSALTATVSVAESVRNLTQGGAFASGANALPGDTLEYRMAVTNSGSTPASAVGVASALPASTTSVPGSFRVGSSATGEGSACPAALCGWVSEAGGSIVAHLGAGATDAAGGDLAPGSTLYVFFRVQVE